MARSTTRAIAYSIISLIVGCQVEQQSEVTQLDGPTGRISGVVTLAYMNIPSPTIVTNTKDPQACGAKIAKLDMVVAEESRGMAHVIVWLADVDLPPGYRPPRQDLRLAVQRCQFSPHVA